MSPYGLTLWKLSSFCTSEIIMVLLRIISSISLFLFLTGLLCGYCISSGYPLDGPVDHCPAYEPLAGFGSLPRLLQPLWVIGVSMVLRWLFWTTVFCPLAFTGFCGAYGPFTLGILRVMTAIGPLGHSMAQLSFLRLRVTLLSAR